MAGETTIVTMDDVTNTSLVEPIIIMALCEQPGHAIRVCREFSGIGKPTNTLHLPVQASYWGTPNDRGAGVDAEFDAVEAVSTGNTAVSTNGVNISTGEYAVAHALTDRVSEDSAVDGAELMTMFVGQMSKVLTLALDDDFMALFASLSNIVGTTTVDLSVAQAIAAQQGLRVRGVDADRIEYLLDNQQALDIESALVGTNSAAAVFALSADRLIGYAPTADHGMGPSRQVMTLRGYPVFASGLTDTANAGADVVGACFCGSSANNDTTGSTTFGLLWKRLPYFETQRQAKGRATDLVMSMRAGVAELQDGSGTGIITDAP